MSEQVCKWCNKPLKKEHGSWVHVRGTDYHNCQHFPAEPAAPEAEPPAVPPAQEYGRVYRTPNGSTYQILRTTQAAVFLKSLDDATEGQVSWPTFQRDFVEVIDQRAQVRAATPEELEAQRESAYRHGALRGERQAQPAGAEPGLPCDKHDNLEPDGRCTCKWVCKVCGAQCVGAHGKDDCIAALKAQLAALRKSQQGCVEALTRIESMAVLLLAGKPVRDVEETMAEVRIALVNAAKVEGR